MIPQRHIKIDAFLHSVARSIEYDNINPKNRNREQFFKTYKDPQFSYDPVSEEIGTMRSVLEAITLDDSPSGKLLDNKRKELILKIKLMQAIGTPQFTKISQKIYRPPSISLVSTCYYMLSRKVTKQKDAHIKRIHTIKTLRGLFKKLNITWKIKSTNIITSARVSPENEILELRKKERFLESYLKRLIVHEIGVHALRAENGKLQPLQLFKHGCGQYLETEEGLAVYAEYKAGLLDDTILHNYAGRVVAVHYALTHGFHETYKHLRQYFTKKTAWKLTVRVKRGLADTSQPGAYTKDALYLRGFLKVKRFAEKKGDINSLFVGKIGLKDIPLVKQLELTPPKYHLQSVIDYVEAHKHFTLERVDSQKTVDEHLKEQ